MIGPDRRHLILFARLPRLGTAKRRLARDIGRVEAWRFADRVTQAMIDRLSAGPWRTWLSLTPDGAADEARRRWRVPPTVTIHDQGRGDLGARMIRALEAVPPGPRLLIGSDLPGVDRPAVERAFAALGTADLVFGPAEDGGFWLVGARHPGDAHGLFRGVRWSTRHALEDALASVPPHRRVALAGPQTDIDDGAAYAGWRATHRPSLRPS